MTSQTKKKLMGAKLGRRGSNALPVKTKMELAEQRLGAPAN
jgi:hypothetical protein